MVLTPILVRIGSPRFRRFLVDLLPGKNVRRVRDAVDSLHNISLEILEANKRTILEEGETSQQGGTRNDVLSILRM
jgi:hypothetical protein